MERLRYALHCHMIPESLQGFDGPLAVTFLLFGSLVRVALLLIIGPLPEQMISISLCGGSSIDRVSPLIAGPVLPVGHNDPQRPGTRPLHTQVDVPGKGGQTGVPGGVRGMPSTV